MKFANKFLFVVACTPLIGGAVFGAWWMIGAKGSTSQDEKHGKAVQVQTVSESDLGKITLSDVAAERLGVETAVVERKSVSRQRIYGGEVVVPIGKSLLVSSPVQGTLQADGDSFPKIGQRVTKGQHLLSLLPLLSPDAITTLSASLADAQGQEKNAQTQLEAANLALDRAQRLYRGEAGSMALS